jgi:hypothetical protein
MPDSTEVADFEQSGGFRPDSESPSNAELEAMPARKPGWKKWLRRILISGLITAGLLIGGIFLLIQLAEVEPEFYTSALNVDPKLQKKYGSEMESKILNLRNSIIGSESWSASFSEDQINGWLAWDLQKKFPDLLPPEVTDPRVELGEKSITFAFRCDVQPFRGIAIVEAEIFMTQVVNEIGIRIKSLQSGMVPIPLAAIADEIARQAAFSELEIEWLTEDGDPVAIVALPESLIRAGGGDLLEVQKFEIRNQKLHVAGVTHPPDY